MGVRSLAHLLEICLYPAISFTKSVCLTVARSSLCSAAGEIFTNFTALPSVVQFIQQFLLFHSIFLYFLLWVLAH
jgi:uncharacterized membrane protein